jgi:hypothetical protein
MARNFNKFTYINNDTLSLMSNLQHNISDLEGRASFSVAAFVPVYDHRLDESAGSPFVSKFGTLSRGGFRSTFPSVFRKNDKSSPFPVLGNQLDGILCDDDIYLWKNRTTSTGRPADYVLSDEGRTINPSYSKSIISIAYMECVLGPRKGDIYLLPTDTDIPQIPISMSQPDINSWNSGNSYADLTAEDNEWQFRKTSIEEGRLLDCIPERNDTTNNMVDDKTLVAFPNDVVYRLSSDGVTVSDEQIGELKYATSVIGKYDDYNSTVYPAENISIPVYSAEIPDGQGTWVQVPSTELKATQTPIYSKSKDVDVTRLKAEHFDAYTSIRYFAKSSQDADGHEKTIANYRVEFNEQVGTVRFNKIVTYVRLYRKDENGRWGWGSRLYPFTVTILPEPVMKSNVGVDGIDVFELDIEIDYDQYADYTMPDFKAVTNIPTFIPVTNTLRNDNDYVTGSVDVDTHTNKYIGTQTDKRLFISTDIDPLSETENNYKWTLTKAEDKWEKRNNINTNYGRLNTDNTNLVYNDIDFSTMKFIPEEANASQISLTISTFNGEVILSNGITLDTHVEVNQDASQEYTTYSGEGISPSLILGTIDLNLYKTLISDFNAQKLAIINYYLGIRKACSENPYDTEILSWTSIDDFTIDAEPGSDEYIKFTNMMADLAILDNTKPIQLQ